MALPDYWPFKSAEEKRAKLAVAQAEGAVRRSQETADRACDPNDPDRNYGDADEKKSEAVESLAKANKAVGALKAKAPADPASARIAAQLTEALRKALREYRETFPAEAQAPKPAAQPTPFARGSEADKYARLWSPELYRKPTEGQRGMFGSETTSRQRGLRWVTIGAQESDDGDRRGGIPVQIDGAGNIVGGKRAQSVGLHGAHVSEAGEVFGERRAIQNEGKSGGDTSFDFGYIGDAPAQPKDKQAKPNAESGSAPAPSVASKRSKPADASGKDDGANDPAYQHYVSASNRAKAPAKPYDEWKADRAARDARRSSPPTDKPTEDAEGSTDFDFGYDDEPAAEAPSGPQNAPGGFAADSTSDVSGARERERREAESKLPGKNTKLRSDLRESVGSDPVRQAGFLETAQGIHRQRILDAKEYNDALDNLLANHLGTDPNDRLRLIGQLRKRSDPSKVEGFDLILDTARRDYPWLLSDPNESSEEAALAEAIKRGRIAEPTLADAWGEALELFYGDEIPDDPDAYWSALDEQAKNAPRDEWDSERFSASAFHRTLYSLRETADRSSCAEAVKYALRHNHGPQASRYGAVTYDDARKASRMAGFVTRYAKRLATEAPEGRS